MNLHSTNGSETSRQPTLIASAGVQMPQVAGESENSLANAWHILMGIQVAAVALVGCYSTWQQKFLYADGSHFFLRILETQAVLTYQPARYFAYVVTQLPVVVMLMFGIRSVGVLAYTYGAMLFFMPVAGLLLTWWAARKAPAQYLAYPLLVFAIIYLDASIFIISEVHVAISLFWPLLYILLFSERLNVTRSATMIALAVVATRTYECYLFLAWPLIFLAARRAWNARNERRYFEVATCIVCILLFLTAVGVSAAFTLVPHRDGESRSQFASSLIEHLNYFPVQFSLLMVICVLWHTIFPRYVPTKLLLLCATVVGIRVALLPISSPIDPLDQYTARVQALYLPLLFGCLVVLNPQILRDVSHESKRCQVALWRLVAITCAVAVCFQWIATTRWSEYRDGLMQDLTRHRGAITYSESVTNGSEFNVPWTLPSLSIVLSAIKQDAVWTIICPGEGEYLPYDPHAPETLPNLTPYGVRMDLVVN